MNEQLENNKYIKYILIGLLMALMFFMLYAFPTSHASSNEEHIVSIR